MTARRWRGVGLAVVVGIAALLAPVGVAAMLKSAGPAAVSFLAIGNRGVRVFGRSQTLWVSDDGHAITLMVPISSLRTGIALRDYHMRSKYLQAERYPDIRLDVPWAAVQRPPPGGVVAADATGLLHLHGQTRPLSFRYTARDQGGVILVDGGFRVDIRDFGIPQPRFLGIRVNPVVEARARFLVTGS